MNVLMKFQLKVVVSFVTFNVGSTNQNSTQEHCYYALASVKTEIKSKFDELLKQTDSKLTEIATVEKNAWKKLDALEVECQKMTENVEKNSKEQVFYIYLYFHILLHKNIAI